MILDFPYDSKLRKLKLGDFSVPRFDHSYDLELADTPRLEGSIRGMMTLMRNHGFAEIVDTFDGHFVDRLFCQFPKRHLTLHATLILQLLDHSLSLTH